LKKFRKNRNRFFTLKKGVLQENIFFQTKDLIIGYDEPLSKKIESGDGEKAEDCFNRGKRNWKNNLVKKYFRTNKTIRGTVERGDYLEIGYFEHEMSKDSKNTCIEEIWSEFPDTPVRSSSGSGEVWSDNKTYRKMVKVLSGGEQAKVRLCKLMNRESNLLLLDEPTNHLDVDAKQELKEPCRNIQGAYLWFVMNRSFMKIWLQIYGIAVSGLQNCKYETVDIKTIVW
jgi:ATPase subunit of ABC transporter with duplicated ATPase domains